MVLYIFFFFYLCIGPFNAYVRACVCGTQMLQGRNDEVFIVLGVQSLAAGWFRAAAVSVDNTSLRDY